MLEISWVPESRAAVVPVTCWDSSLGFSALHTHGVAGVRHSTEQSLEAQWLRLYLIFDLGELFMDIFILKCFHIMFVNFYFKNDGQAQPYIWSFRISLVLKIKAQYFKWNFQVLLTFLCLKLLMDTNMQICCGDVLCINSCLTWACASACLLVFYCSVILKICWYSLRSLSLFREMDFGGKTLFLKAAVCYDVILKGLWKKLLILRSSLVLFNVISLHCLSW